MSTVRNPDQTRARLLEAAFEEIYQHGFQGMRVDEILERTGLKKGAFYHHFSTQPGGRDAPRSTLCARWSTR